MELLNTAPGRTPGQVSAAPTGVAVATLGGVRAHGTPPRVHERVVDVVVGVVDRSEASACAGRMPSSAADANTSTGSRRITIPTVGCGSSCGGCEDSPDVGRAHLRPAGIGDRADA